ncbi:MAG: hypothetical protein V1843_02700 [bacterium]
MADRNRLSTAGAFGRGLTTMTGVLNSLDESEYRKVLTDKARTEVENQAGFRNAMSNFDPAGPLDQPALKEAYSYDPAKTTTIIQGLQEQRTKQISTHKAIMGVAAGMAAQILNSPNPEANWAPAREVFIKQFPDADSWLSKQFPGVDALKAFVGRNTQRNIISTPGGAYDQTTNQIIPGTGRPSSRNPAVDQSIVDKNTAMAERYRNMPTAAERPPSVAEQKLYDPNIIEAAVIKANPWEKNQFDYKARAKSELIPPDKLFPTTSWGKSVTKPFSKLSEDEQDNINNSLALQINAKAKALWQQDIDAETTKRVGRARQQYGPGKVKSGSVSLSESDKNTLRGLKEGQSINLGGTTYKKINGVVNRYTGAAPATERAPAATTNVEEEDEE